MHLYRFWKLPYKLIKLAIISVDEEIYTPSWLAPAHIKREQPSLGSARYSAEIRAARGETASAAAFYGNGNR